jgi:hypothetical protein
LRERSDVGSSAGTKKTAGVQAAVFVAAVLVGLSGLMGIGSPAHSEQRVTGDLNALREAVKGYFSAEISGDPKRVWEMLAPSSEFKKAYSYEFYEEMQRREGIRVKSYKLIEILGVKENSDKKSMPRVDMIAAVRVDVVLASREGKDTRHTIVLTFLHEAGKWYKG